MFLILYEGNEKQPKTLDNIDWQPDNFMWLVAHKAKVT